MNSAAQNGAWLAGEPGQDRRKMWFITTNNAARPRTPSRPTTRAGLPAGRSSLTGVPAAARAGTRLDGAGAGDRPTVADVRAVPALRSVAPGARTTAVS